MPGKHGSGETGGALSSPAISRVESFSPPRKVTASDHRIIRGDALDIGDALIAEGLRGKVDLVYIDPPFASQADYINEVRLDGPADGRVVRTRAYTDTWSSDLAGDDGVGAYLDRLAPRLARMAELLSPRGSMWVHLDWRAAYLVRVILDEIFGRRNFLNEIVWRRAPNLGRQAASKQYGRTIDTIVVYGNSEAVLDPAKRLEPIEPNAIRLDDEGRRFTAAPRGDYTDESIKRLDAIGRVHRTSSGRVYIKYFLEKNADGEWCRDRRVDALWTDIAPLRHAPASERTGYPTQKPVALLERIIASGSPPGGLVVDLYAGSGTTAVAAHALGRRSIVGDTGGLSIAVARARLLRDGAPYTIDQCDANEVRPYSSSLAADALVITAIPNRQVQIELRQSEEPLAWAIDTDFDPNRGFVVTWHSEHQPGAKSRPVERRAIAPASPNLAVRIYGTDGSVSDYYADATQLRSASEEAEKQPFLATKQDIL